MITVWQSINHDSILSAVEGTLQEKLSNLLLPRNSYINRVYELEKYDSRERFIVKFYRPCRWTQEMILEEHRFLNELHEKEVPVVPPLKINNKTLFEYTPKPNPLPFAYALFPKKSGRALTNSIKIPRKSWGAYWRESTWLVRHTKHQNA
jgi:Ser/Thr protein kinase RdoA (MazF antagonist)